MDDVVLTHRRDDIVLTHRRENVVIAQRVDDVVFAHRIETMLYLHIVGIMLNLYVVSKSFRKNCQFRKYFDYAKKTQPQYNIKMFTKNFSIIKLLPGKTFISLAGIRKYRYCCKQSTGFQWTPLPG